MQHLMQHLIKQCCIKCCTCLSSMLHDVGHASMLQRKIVYVVLLHSFAIPMLYTFCATFCFFEHQIKCQIVKSNVKLPQHNVLSCWCPCSKIFFCFTQRMLFILRESVICKSFFLYLWCWSMLYPLHEEILSGSLYFACKALSFSLYKQKIFCESFIVRVCLL